MKYIFILFFLFYAFLHAKTLDKAWTAYIGCYKTLEMNGNKVNHPKNAPNTEISAGPSLYKDIKGHKIESINFEVFQSHRIDEDNDDVSRFDYNTAFLDRGKFKGNSYSFRGQVEFKKDLVDKVIKITISKIKDNIFTLTLYSKSNVKGKSYIDDNFYRLEKIKCH